MENRRYKLSFVLAFFLLIGAAAVYAATLRFELENKVNYLIYALVFLMLGILAYQSFREEEYPPAFEFKKSKGVASSAFLAGIGFLIDFINSAVGLYSSLNEKRINFAGVGANAVSVVFALLSSLYFITVFVSYKYTSNDFRRLKFLHFAPLIWAFAKSGLIILNAVAFKEDVFSSVKGLMLIFAILFFFSFAYEIENESGAKKAFVFFLGAFSYLCLLLFFIGFIDICYKKTALLSENTAFALSSFCIFFFVHYFRNNLLSPRI